MYVNTPRRFASDSTASLFPSNDGAKRPQAMGLRVPLDTLRNAITESLWGAVKAQDLPDMCARFGLAEGTIEEAFRSKRGYVRARLRSLSGVNLLKLASKVLEEFDVIQLRDLVSELTTHSEQRVSDLTRREVMKVLNGLDPLFGDIPLLDGLDVIGPLWSRPSATGGYMDTLADDVNQHYIRNPDYSNFDLLEMCGTLTCSQQRFFDLIGKLLDPAARRGNEQADLARRLNDVLSADGFHAVVIGQQSRHPIFGIARMVSGVPGRPKNLVFASINAKPDLYFTDAINNDIAIRNETDALIYDEFLGDAGLSWSAMVAWWQAHEGVPDPVDAARGLYKRLARSVIAAGSAGEFALFDTYYREFRAVLGDQLPALVPQVYLHYDPRTMGERGRDPVLLRQRMDLLLLLDRNIRIVAEVDGKQHYADGNVASSLKYAEMVAQDRRLRLAGYELYRFGAAEFSDVKMIDGKFKVGPTSRALAKTFFERLFERHHVRREI